MPTKPILRTIAISSIVLAFALACTFHIGPTVIPTATPVPTFTPPPITPTPQGGMGVPVASGMWQITIEGAREESSIESGFYPNRTTYTPKEGLTFLIVDLSVRTLEPGQTIAVSSMEVAIIGKDGDIHTAEGGGFSESNLCAACIVTMSMTGEKLTASFVFVIPQDRINEQWKLQYKDAPSIPFSMNEKPPSAYVTEIGPFDDYLPSACNFSAAPKTIGAEGILTFKSWENNGLTLETLLPGEASRAKLCSGLAYGDMQWTTDGAALLLLGPMQGWPSLSIVEPNGQTIALVRNGRDIWATLDASGQFVLFTTYHLGEEQEKLYVYDRASRKTTLLQEGNWINVRLLDGGKLIVNVSPLSGDTAIYSGKVGDTALTPLTLPDGAEFNNITADGAHVIFMGGSYPNQVLRLASLDGTESRDIQPIEGWGYNGILSLDGKHILFSRPDSDKEAVLLNLETGEETSIVSNVESLRFAFSADSKWGLVFSTADADSSASGSDEKKHTLHVVETGTGQTVHTLQNVESARFSPDGTRLAYTVTNADGTVESFLLNLADGVSTSLGDGVLSGWWPFIVTP